MRTGYVICVRVVALVALSGSASGALGDNYVRTWVYADSTGADSRSVVSTVYYDGMGRECLRVIGTPQLPDAFTAQRTDYNGRGLRERVWLAVPGAEENIDAATYRAAAKSFYGDDMPYSRFEYEASSRNRVSAEYGPGKYWERHGTGYVRHACTASGDYSCRMVLVDDEGNVYTDGTYAPGSLRVLETEDADGRRLLQFQNRTGRTVAERRLKDGVIAETRYVYDVYGDLRYVLTPAATAQLPVAGTVDAGVLEKYARSYTYDVRSRLTSSTSAVYSHHVGYAADAATGVTTAPSYTMVNASTDSWHSGGGSGLPGYSLTLGYSYDALGRLQQATDASGSISETLETDPDANVVAVRRNYMGACVQDAVLDFDGEVPTAVRDVSTPYHQDAVGRFAPGDYAMSHDILGRLVADESRQIKSIRYCPWGDLPQRIKMENGDEILNTYLSDGTLLKRQFCSSRIVTLTRVNSKGDTIIRQVSRPVIDSHVYLGSFDYDWSYSLRRLNTSVGFYDTRSRRHYWHLTNWQGSVMAVVDGSGNVVQRSGLYPSGTPFVLPVDIAADTVTMRLGAASDRLHIGNRWQSHSGLNWYDNTARMHDPLLLRFTTQDPLAGKYGSVSPYSHCQANPAMFIDPDGRSTKVKELDNGTYQVFGGDLKDHDRNIYVYSQDENGEYTVKGKSIGITTSITSFYNSDDNGGEWKESIIDPNDMSGEKFLSHIINNKPPLFDDYMVNARSNHPYDFKKTNGTSSEIKRIDTYRGMPIGFVNGQRLYSSARDIGNIAAGYIAAVNGLSWRLARAGFDGYQSISNVRLEAEGISTRNAEFYGWVMGCRSTSIFNRIHNFGNSVQSPLNKAANEVMRKAKSGLNYLKSIIGF